VLWTTALVAAGLSGGQKLGLALVGAAFIVFSLISSFVVPRRKPNFPGRGLPWFLLVSVLFFVGMLAAVLTLGKEREAAKAANPATTTSTQPTSTTGAPAKAPQGDPVAGRSVFASAGCTGCHTLKAAGATGTVGPNLDQLKPPYARIVRQVEHGGKIMPPFAGRLSATQIHDVAAFVYVSTH
jgi:mono/diheme cytochrome c family protein